MWRGCGKNEAFKAKIASLIFRTDMVAIPWIGEEYNPTNRIIHHEFYSFFIMSFFLSEVERKLL